jgi:hypothetical protein
MRAIASLGCEKATRAIASSRAAGGPRRSFVPLVPTVQTCASGGAPAAKLNSPKVHRREGQLTTVPIQPDIFALYRCTFAESFFSCCDSVAVLALANCNEHGAEANIVKYFATAPAHTQRSLYGSKSSIGLSGKAS